MLCFLLYFILCLHSFRLCIYHVFLTFTELLLSGFFISCCCCLGRLGNWRHKKKTLFTQDRWLISKRIINLRLSAVDLNGNLRSSETNVFFHYISQTVAFGDDYEEEKTSVGKGTQWLDYVGAEKVKIHFSVLEWVSYFRKTADEETNSQISSQKDVLRIGPTY